MAVEPIKPSADGATHSSYLHLPIVQGRCPACGCHLLFLGEGGYVTCSKNDCSDPEAATKVLEGRMAAGGSEHLAVLLEANRIFEHRNPIYKSMWKRYGWRGGLVHARTCVERAWEEWWGAKPGTEPKVDNLLDGINYAAITIRNIRANNRDGTWW